MPGRPILLPTVLIVLAVAGLAGCASTTPARNPLGETFPSVEGTTLEGEPARLPERFAGAPAVLLIGYRQSAQFDLDRWMVGLLQAGVDVPVVEVPTVQGLGPSVFAGAIDEGMRSGIPREDWPGVITLYGAAADPVAELTGTENGSLGRVIVLDADGRVAWFDDAGFSARKALDLVDAARSLPIAKTP